MKRKRNVSEQIQQRNWNNISVLFCEEFTVYVQQTYSIRTVDVTVYVNFTAVDVQFIMGDYGSYYLSISYIKSTSTAVKLTSTVTSTVRLLYVYYEFLAT